MTQSSESHPLRVAIIGSGPSAFYAADHLLKQQAFNVQVDMYDRLPTPFGLVRGGVAPDHQKIKSVTRIFDKVAQNPNFRFYGNVEYGTDITLEDIQQHYHQVLFATGAQTDRKLGIPGEDLEGSHPATEFVAWYNGHPDYHDHTFNLEVESAAVIGVGNVAIDVARILSLSPDELAQTDIADYALEELCRSNIKTVYLLGRRGPAQAAFTNPEIKEVGELEDADVIVPLDEATLDPLSRAELEANPDRGTQTKVEIIQEYAHRQPGGKPKKLVIRFLVSPVEILGDEHGHVRAVKLVKNKLYATEAGTLRPQATDEYEEIPVGLVFRSVGYRGVPLPGVPFNDKWGVVWNQQGRVIDPATNEPVVGMYTAGWIKRGPSGVIGTNKPDSVETVNAMLADASEDRTFKPSAPNRDAAEQLVREHQPRYVSYADWQRLDALEQQRGKEQNRPRVKFTSIDDMLAALGK